MLGKLIKYDLKWDYKVLVIFYILTIFFAIVGRGLSFIENSTVFDFLSKFSCGVSVSFMINALINNIMRLWARFIHNVYKDEAYLTHTLPVKKSEIYFSKVISTFITLFTTSVVIVIGFLICYYSDGLIDFLKAFITDSLLEVIIYVLIVLFLEILFIQVLGYLGIVIGYKHNNDKLIRTIIISFTLYMLSSFVSLGAVFVLGLFNSDVLAMFTTSNSIPSMDVLKLILIVAIICYLVYIILCNVVSVKLLQRGVDVD